MKKRLKKIVTTVKKSWNFESSADFGRRLFCLVQLADDSCVPGMRKYAGNICLRSCGGNHWRVWHMRLDPDKQRQTAGSEMAETG